MGTAKHVAATVLAVALLLGLLADTLLRGIPLGLNGVIWSTVFVIGMIVPQRGSGKEVLRDPIFAILMIPACSVLLLWRASDVLAAFCVLSMIVLTSTLLFNSGLKKAYILQYVHALLASALHAAVGMVFLCFGDLRTERSANYREGRVWPIIRGIGLSIPVVLLFGSLFVAADAVFERAVKSAFDIDIASLLQHLFTIGFAAWIVGGFLRGKFIAGPVRLPENAHPKSLYLGVKEVGTFLGIVNLLFALFVIVQIRYLFGGADLITVTPGLTYAEYARRGFFELVMVAALSLPLLLATDWIVSAETRRAKRVVRSLMGLHIILLVTIMASALRRMFLYQAEYGLTEARVYPTAFMVWLLLLICWFALTVLRGRRERFAFGALVSGMCVLLALFVINPEDLIARTNFARAREGKRFDAHYVAQLGSDAAPALLGSLDALSPEDRAYVAHMLLMRNNRLGGLDWRSWNFGRATAFRLVQEQEANLQKLADGFNHKEE